MSPLDSLVLQQQPGHAARSKVSQYNILPRVTGGRRLLCQSRWIILIAFAFTIIIDGQELMGEGEAVIY